MFHESRTIGGTRRLWGRGGRAFAGIGTGNGRAPDRVVRTSGAERGARRRRGGQRGGALRRYLAAALVCCAAIAVPGTAMAWVCGGSVISNVTHYRVLNGQFRVGLVRDTSMYGYTPSETGSFLGADYFGGLHLPGLREPFTFFPRPAGVYDWTLSGPYRFASILNDSGEIEVKLNKLLTADDRRALSIRLCGQTLAFSAATEDTLDKTYTWSNTGQDWSRLTLPGHLDVHDGREYYGTVSVSIGVDKALVAPRVTDVEVISNTIRLTFDKPLSDTTLPPASAFTLQLSEHPGGGDRAYPDVSPLTVSSMQVTGTGNRELTLVLDSGPPQFDGFAPSPIIDYAVPTSNALQGENGAKVRAFSGRRVTKRIARIRPSRATISRIAFSGAGADNKWTNGENLVVEYNFSSPVTITLPAGRTLEANGPVVVFRPYGDRVGNYCGDNPASYLGGDGTNQLRFGCTIANGTHDVIAVFENALRPRDANIWSFGTTGNVPWYRHVNGTHAATNSSASAASAAAPPEIVGSPTLSPEGPDGAWSPGETVEATLSFSEAVVVDTTDGTPTVELLLGGTAAKAASYLRGSGSETLVFGYTLTDDDGSHSSMMLSIDSLALNGGTIRSRSSELDALLTHAGAAVVAPPMSARSSEGTVGTDATVETAEDTAYTFRPSDFGFSDDAKRDRTSHVTIATLPGAGSLTVDGSAARQHQIVDKTDIGTGALVFTPAANAHGDAWASFEFRTYNGRTESAAATMTIDVTPENDAPTGVPEIAGTAEAGRTATASIGSVSDADGTENAQFAYRWIRVADGAETPIAGATGQRYVLGADDVGHRVKVEVSFTDDDGTAERAESAAWPAEGAIAAAPGITATFSGVPESHDGSTEFTVELRFSEEPPGLRYRTVGGSLLETTNARVRGARRLTPGSNLGWEITVGPRGPGEVSLTLPVRECSRTNAICVGGRALGAAVTTRIAHAVATPGETPQQVSQTPLTAELAGVPGGHDGSAFTFELRLSEDVEELGYETVRDSAFSVTGGRVTKARRLAPPSNQRWEVHVQPSGYADMTLALNATQDCAARGAICTPGGEEAVDLGERDGPGSGDALGGGRACARGGGRDARLHGLAEPRGGGRRDGGLRDGGRERDGRRRLHRDRGHAHLRGGRDEPDRFGAGARRRVRRGERDADAHALEPVADEREAGRRQRDGHHRERRCDAAGVACAVRAHGGGAGAGGGGEPDAGGARSRGRGVACGPAHRLAAGRGHRARGRDGGRRVRAGRWHGFGTDALAGREPGRGRDAGTEVFGRLRTGAGFGRGGGPRGVAAG